MRYNYGGILNSCTNKMKLIHSLEKFGDFGQYALPALVGSSALLSGNPIEAIAMGILGYVQKIEVFAIKRNFPRERPGPFIEGKVSREDSESFPSSHTGGAFLAVGLAGGLYGMTNPFSVTLIALACLVGASRYYSKKHWLSDILAGALIGIINGYLAANCVYILYPLKA